MKRVLLKLSGEALAGEKKTGFDEATCIGVAKQVKQLVDEGVQVAIVTGGGNFWRGRTSETIVRFVNKMLNHFFGDFKIGNHAVAQRTDRMLCKRFGAAMVYTEFVSAEALVRSIKSTVSKLPGWIHRCCKETEHRNN